MRKREHEAVWSVVGYKSRYSRGERIHAEGEGADKGGKMNYLREDKNFFSRK